MPTYLVTGAAGFIGAKVCEMLLEDGHSVVGIDNLNDYYDVRLKDYRLSKLLAARDWTPGNEPKCSQFFDCGRLQREKFIFERIDIEDRVALEQLFKNFAFDAVLNLAARAGVRYSLDNPHIYLSTNTVGTLNLLECMRHSNCRKMVLASTSSLYAGEGMPFSEDLAVNSPLSPYAASKKAAELMAHSYYRLYNLDVSVVRYFTVFGPAGRPDMSIFRFIKWIDEDKPVEILGDGSQSRDFTYVDDVARGTIQACRPVGYEIFNIGGGRNPLSLDQIIALIASARGGLSVKQSRQAAQQADILTTQADISKARKMLGYKPVVSVEDGLTHVLDWHSSNKKWLQHISL